mgnify:FL=1
MIFLIHKLIICFLSFFLGLIFSFDCKAQETGENESIAKHRKGEITVRAKKGSEVKVEQLKHEFWFGCAIPNSLAGGMSQENLKLFKEKFLENFNCAVTENALKWMVMERNKGEINYAVVDAILEWCDENDIPARGHNMFWGTTNNVQSWLKEMSDDELKQAIQHRAVSITSYYKGRFAEYDLNNEMLASNYYEERLGSGITKLMAQWALEGDPDAKLFLNDFDILIPDPPRGPMLSAYMSQIRNFLKQGIPIAGIGVQGHSHLESFDRQYLKDALDSLSVFKIPIRITEFNMPGMRSEFRRTQLTQDQEEAKAKEIVDYYKICFAHPAVEGILMWGFWEGANWIPSSSLYKLDWTPTPSSDAYRNLVFNEWWTDVTGTTDKKGVYSVPAFYGKYKVTVNGVSKEVDLTKAAGKIIVDFKR